MYRFHSFSYSGNPIYRRGVISSARVYSGHDPDRRLVGPSRPRIRDPASHKHGWTNHQRSNTEQPEQRRRMLEPTAKFRVGSLDYNGQPMPPFASRKKPRYSIESIHSNGFNPRQDESNYDLRFNESKVINVDYSQQDYHFDLDPASSMKNVEIYDNDLGPHKESSPNRGMSRFQISENLSTSLFQGMSQYNNESTILDPETMIDGYENDPLQSNLPNQSMSHFRHARLPKKPGLDANKIIGKSQDMSRFNSSQTSRFSSPNLYSTKKVGLDVRKITGNSFGFPLMFHSFERSSVSDIDGHHSDACFDNIHHLEDPHETNSAGRSTAPIPSSSIEPDLYFPLEFEDYDSHNNQVTNRMNSENVSQKNTIADEFLFEHVSSNTSSYQNTDDTASCGYFATEHNAYSNREDLPEMDFAVCGTSDFTDFDTFPWDDSFNDQSYQYSGQKRKGRGVPFVMRLNAEREARRARLAEERQRNKAVSWNVAEDGVASEDATQRQSNVTTDADINAILHGDLKAPNDSDPSTSPDACRESLERAEEPVALLEDSWEYNFGMNDGGNDVDANSAPF